MENSKTQLLASELSPVIIKLVKKLRKQATTERFLSQGERSVLILLEKNESLLAAELATIEKITPQSMGQIIKRLFDLRLILKKTSATDKRKVNIFLSAKGKKIIQTVKSERIEWLAGAIAAVCNKAEMTFLKAAIIPLTKVLDFE
jgi:DNA-binding MarR family transcriptional regulator